MNIIDHALSVIDKKNMANNEAEELLKVLRDILDNDQLSDSDKLKAMDLLIPRATQ